MKSFGIVYSTHYSLPLSLSLTATHLYKQIARVNNAMNWMQNESRKQGEHATIERFQFRLQINKPPSNKPPDQLQSSPSTTAQHNEQMRKCAALAHSVKNLTSAHPNTHKFARDYK